METKSILTPQCDNNDVFWSSKFDCYMNIGITLHQLTTGALVSCIIHDRILDNHPYGCILHIEYLEKQLERFCFLLIYGYNYGYNTVKMF